MKRFGEKFEEYVPLEVEHVAIPETGEKNGVTFLENYGLDKNLLPEIMPRDTPYASKTGQVELFRVLAGSDIPTKMNLDLGLDKSVVKIAPTANVYRIPDDKQGLADQIKNTLTQFNYYIVELGLEVLLGREHKISQLLLEVDLRCNGPDRTDVTAYDIAPDDTVKHVKILSGKISLGITNLLGFVYNPIGAALQRLLDLNVQINPWEFEWGFDKYMIDAAGKKDYRVYWKIYETEVVQGFNPTMILKARKSVERIYANVKGMYRLKTPFWKSTQDVKLRGREVKIWPT